MSPILSPGEKHLRASNNAYQRGLREGEIKGLLRAARWLARWARLPGGMASRWCRAAAEKLRERERA